MESSNYTLQRQQKLKPVPSFKLNFSMNSETTSGNGDGLWHWDDFLPDVEAKAKQQQSQVREEQEVSRQSFVEFQVHLRVYGNMAHFLSAMLCAWSLYWTMCKAMGR